MLAFYLKARKAFAAGYGAAAAVLGPKLILGQPPSQTDLALAIGMAILVGGAVFFVRNSA